MQDTQITSEKYGSYVNSIGIYGFFGHYRWLSNFHLVNIEIDGITYSSTEAAYMSFKKKDRKYKIKLSQATPLEAKKIGSGNFKPVNNWDGIRIPSMYYVNKLKYLNDLGLRKRLLDTGDLYIEETNTWHDKFWGVCNGKGENNLGKILMKIREEAKEWN